MVPPVNERGLNGVKEMAIVMMFIAGEGDIITHLVKPCKQCCVDVITHLNEFPAALFFFSRIKPSDTNMPQCVFFHGSRLSQVNRMHFAATCINLRHRVGEIQHFAIFVAKISIVSKIGKNKK